MRQFFVRARRESTSGSSPTSRGGISYLSSSSSTVREFRLPGIRGFELPGIFEGGASVFGASRGSSHRSYICGSFCICRQLSVANNTFHGYVCAYGSVRGGRPLSCGEGGRSHEVGACRVVQFGKSRSPLDVVVAEGRCYLRRRACRGSAISGEYGLAEVVGRLGFD